MKHYLFAAAITATLLTAPTAGASPRFCENHPTQNGRTYMRVCEGQPNQTGGGYSKPECEGPLCVPVLRTRDEHPTEDTPVDPAADDQDDSDSAESADSGADSDASSDAGGA